MRSCDQVCPYCQKDKSHKKIYYTWREDIWIEANVERGVADRAYSFTGVEDHLSAFRVCVKANVPQNVNK